METKLLKIPMNPNSRERVGELIEYMKLNIEHPENEMAQKGYYWDSVFYDCELDQEFLYVVLKSEDFSKIMMDESELIETPYRKVYEKFRQECWSPGPYRDVEPVFCFNQTIKFGV